MFWVVLGGAGTAYAALLIFGYGVPFGGGFNRGDAGSVADWTAGIATTATLVYTATELRRAARSERVAEAQSIFVVVTTETADEPFAGNPCVISAELRHHGKRPMKVRCLSLRYGSHEAHADPMMVGPDNAPEERMRVELAVPSATFDRKNVQVVATWLDVWGEQHSWRDDGEPALSDKV